MSTTSQTPTREQARSALIKQAISSIKQIHREEGIDRASLAKTAQVLEELAGHRDLFSFDDFPPAASAQESSARYALSADADQSYALYLNVQKPGKNNVPHNHKTWVTIVAVAGEELNRIYKRADDGSNPQQARLELEREVVVQPGTSITYLGEDIHSIHVTGQAPTLHFHLYGKALETLQERVAFDLETGAVNPYNRKYWRPNAR